MYGVAHMRSFMKIIIAAAAAAALAVIALAVFAKIIITPERIREAVVPAAETALNRNVQLGDISIRFFSGIILHDLLIMGHGSDEVFLSVSQASLRYRFLPLLSLQVVIDELQLEEPHITIMRLPDGTFNFSDLIAADGATVPATPRREKTAQSGGLPVSLTIATVRLTRGSVLFIDKGPGTAAPVQHHISGLTIAARAITPDAAFPFELACRLNDAALRIEGRADMRSRSASARIDLTNLDAAALMPYATDVIPGRLHSLTANLHAKLEGDANQISASGMLELRDIDILLNDLPEAPISKAALSAEFDIAADLNASAVQLRSTRLTYNGISALAAGRIEQLDSNPLLSLDVSAPGLSVAALMAALPPELVAEASAMNPSGSLDIQARLEGPAESAAVLKKTEIRLREVQATLGGMRPVLSGSLQLTDDRLVSQDLMLDAAGSRASIELTAENLFDTPIITTQRISAERFDIDALFTTSTAGGRSAGSKKSAPQQEKLKPAEEIGPFDLPVRADGTVKIARAVYKGLIINDFDCVYRLADNVLTVDNMTGSSAGGSFSQSGRVDLGRRGLAYKSTLSVQGLQADPVLSAFLPGTKGKLFGSLNLDLAASGTGTLTDTFKKNLECTSQIDLTDGRITGLGLAKSLADFLNLNELRELRFSRFGGTVNIARGQARLDTELNGDDVRMRPQGVVGLDGSLDIDLNAALSPAIMKKLDKRDRLALVLTDNQGWGRLPITIGGSLDRPRFSLDAAGLKEQAIENLQQRLIERLVPKEKPAADSGVETQQNLSPAAPPEPEPQARQKTHKDRKKKQRQERRELLEDTLRDVLSR
ncbi:MAG: AsmA family protein [Deltaproteobacteria bacterium]|nr:AsmA family protein [Deltaproteobacteria bacterium]